MTVRVTRREALHRFGVAALAAGVPAALVGCASTDAEVEARLVRALTQISETPAAPTAIATAARLTRAEAVAKLRGDAGARTLWLVTSTGVAMRAWLERSRDADLESGRVRWIHGWLLTETEIAAARLVAG